MIGHLAKLLISCMALVLAHGAHAQAPWPEKPVRIVVPFPAGGGYDIMARTVGAQLSKVWGQTVIVENKSGANEIVAADYVAKSKPDGYTLMFASATSLTTNQILYANLPYSPRSDFLPITRVAQGPIVYIVRADAPYTSLTSLIEAAKSRPEKISYGSSGAGGSVNIEVSWLGTVAGVKFLHIPYQGLAPAIKDVLGGSIDFSAVPLAAAAELIKAGQLRAIAVSSVARISALSDVPTTTELGWAGTDYSFLMGLVAPAKTPPAVAEKVSRDVAKVLSSPELISRQFDPFGYSPVGDSPAEFSAYLDKFYEAQQQRIRAMKVKLD